MASPGDLSPDASTPASAAPAAAAAAVAASSAAPQAPVAEELPESIEDFDSLLNGPVSKYVALSKDIGGLVAKQVRKQKTRCIQDLSNANNETGRACLHRIQGAA